MEIKKLIPNIMVDDINKTLKFYINVLEFEVVMTFPETGTMQWAMIKRGDTEIMFQARESLGEEIPEMKDKPIGASLTFYIGVSDVEDFYEEIKSKVKVVQELHKTHYKTEEFSFEDCNGYILVFAERLM